MTEPGDSIVLVLSNPDDPTADAVLNALAARSGRTVRLDTGTFPARMRMAVCNVAGWHGQLRTDDAVLDTERVAAVYYRRPTKFTFPDGLSNADRAYAEAEARLGLGGVLSALNCRYVNHPHATARAEYKPVQHTIAHRVGLTVPATLISNDLTAAVQFARSVDGPVVCKTLSSLVLGDRTGKPLITYTTPVSVEEIDADEFAATAHYLQAWVPKLWEARVTMVGRRPFGVAIRADSPAAHIDWRADYGSLRYTRIEPPREITAAMCRYLDESGLSFGAFDFAIDANGTWWFFECNPNAQWLWLEEQTNTDISGALADLLTGGLPC